MLQGKSFDEAISNFALSAKDAGIVYSEFKYMFAEGPARDSVRESLMDQGLIVKIPKQGFFLVEWAD